MFSLQQEYSLLRLAKSKLQRTMELEGQNREYDLRKLIAHSTLVENVSDHIEQTLSSSGGYNSSSSSCSSGGGSYIDISEPEELTESLTISDDGDDRYTITDIRSNREDYELSSYVISGLPRLGNGSSMVHSTGRSRVPQLEAPTIVTVSPEAYDSDEEYDSNSDPESDLDSETEDY